MYRLLTSIPKELQIGDYLTGSGHVGLLNGEGYRWDIPHSHKMQWAIVGVEQVIPVRGHNVVTFEEGKVLATGDLPTVAELLAATHPAVMGTFVTNASDMVQVGNNSTVILPGTGHEVVAGDYCTIILGHDAAVTAGDENVVTVGPDSEVIIGQRSRCISNGGNTKITGGYASHVMINGSLCHINVGSNSTICCRSAENTVTADNGSSIMHPAMGACVVAAEACNVTVGNDSRVTTGPRCIVTAGYNSRVAGGYGSVICFRYVDDATGLMHAQTGTVDDQTLISGASYTLNNAHAFQCCS